MRALAGVDVSVYLQKMVDRNFTDRIRKNDKDDDPL